MADTPLGNVISIRSENDGERLKYFTPAQKKIRSEWRKKQTTVYNMDALFTAALA